MSDGVKNDAEKIQLELLSTRWLLGVGQVLTFGAKKYAAHNWRKGLQRSRLLGAVLRHIVAYLGGEDLDPETGLLHLHHASCCLMFASELHETRPDLDDRYRQGQVGATLEKHPFPNLAAQAMSAEQGMQNALQSQQVPRCPIHSASFLTRTGIRVCTVRDCDWRDSL